MSQVNSPFGIKIGADIDGNVRLNGDLTVTGDALFQGNIDIPTQSNTDNSTKAASTAYVKGVVGDLINSAPGALDTLNELAAALGNDPNFATTVTNNLSLKAPLNSPALTGTPTAPTPSASDNSTKLATTAYVDTADALKAPLNNPAFTGNPTAPTQAVDNNSTRLATTAFVLAQAGSASPTMNNGSAVVGTSTRFSRQDHVHPSDTSKASLSGDIFTGTLQTSTADGTFGLKSKGASGLVRVSGFTTSGGIIESINASETVALPLDLKSSLLRLNAAGGRVLVGTSTDNGIDALQVNGTVSASLLKGVANLSSTSTSVTPSANDNSTKIATTAYVDAADALKAPLNDAALTGKTTIAGSLSTDDFKFIFSPGGGRYNTTSSPTGSFKIKLPLSYTDSAIRMTVQVFEGSSNKSFEMVVGGFNQSSTPTWTNTFAYMIGDSSSKTPNVRFGNDGSTCCIWIGDVADVWSTPQVIVKDVSIGYGGQATGWLTGWTVTNVATLDTIKVGPSVPFKASGVYTLPMSSASVLGGIKIGSGLAIDGAGVVTATAGAQANSDWNSTSGVTKIYNKPAVMELKGITIVPPVTATGGTNFTTGNLGYVMVINSVNTGFSQGDFYRLPSTSGSVNKSITVYCGGTDTFNLRLAIGESGTHIKVDGTAVSSLTLAGGDLVWLYSDGTDWTVVVTNRQTSNSILTALGYSPEAVSNKVTSISGASTNTQYPSAKLLFDQLALKLTTSASTDALTEGSTNKYFTEPSVLATVLAGLSTATSTAATSADSVLVGVGKLQSQTTLRELLSNKVISVSGASTDTQYPSAKLLFNQLALKADLTGATFTGAVNMAKGADIASASTIDLDATTGNLVHITGTTSISAVTLSSGRTRTVIFDGVLDLYHHPTLNNLPGSTFITTAAGDRAVYQGDGSTVQCISYVRANGVSAKYLNDFIQDRATTTGLTYGYKAGEVQQNTGAVLIVPAGTITLSTNANNYIEVVNGVVVKNNAFTPGGIPLSIAVTNGLTMIGLTDHRTFITPNVSRNTPNGFVGLTSLKINFLNNANSFTSYLQNLNTASRTYTFPDKDLTVAEAGANDSITSLKGLNALSTINLNASPTLPTPMNGTVWQMCGNGISVTRLLLEGSGVSASITGRASGGTLAAPTATPAGLALMSIVGAGYGTGYGTAGSSAMVFIAKNTWSATDNSSYIDWYTTAGATTSSLQRMRLDDAGNLGVGQTTINPSFKIHALGGGICAEATSTFYTTLGVSPSAAGSPNTFAGMWYDSANNALRIEALSGGVAWRNIGLGVAGGNVLIGTTTNDAINKLQVAGSAKFTGGIALPIVTQAGPTYTVAVTDSSIIISGGAAITTLTLPAAASFTGRFLRVLNRAAFTVVSASSNVIPIAGGAAGTAIIPATTGKWVDLQSDGTVWQTIAGN